MDLAAKKLELINWLANTEDELLLDELDKLRKKIRSSEHFSTPLSAEAYKSVLEEALEGYKLGKHISQEDIENEYKNW